MDDEWIKYGSLRAKDQSLPRPFEMRFVRHEELDALHRLHQAVVAGLHHPHLFRPDSRAFMSQHIEARGRTVGIFVDRDLIAYAVISFPNDDPDNLGRDLPLPPEEFAHVADYDGSAVRPDFRGNRLQQRMTEMRHRYALANDRYHILGTVSPQNAYSLANFLAIGCRVKGVKEKYGGMLRLIIHRDLREDQPIAFDPDSLCDVALDDIARITIRLRHGFEGFQVIRGQGRPHLRMGHLIGRERPASTMGFPLNAGWPFRQEACPLPCPEGRANGRSTG